MNIAERSPIGFVVESYQILGRETDDQNNWAGADMRLNIPPLGHFFLNVVTKHQLAEEQDRDALVAEGQIKRLLAPHRDDSLEDEKPPYVLDYALITTKVLDAAFLGCEVNEKLAASLWLEDAFPNA